MAAEVLAYLNEQKTSSPVDLRSTWGEIEDYYSKK